MKYHNWPELDYKAAKHTYQTLHLWTQIVGKIKVALLPWVNHAWHTTLKVTPTGFTTGNLSSEDIHFQIDFNFVDHQLKISTSNNEFIKFQLEDLSVASFYKKLFFELEKLGIHVTIHNTPNEVENPIPFAEDKSHATYQPEHARKLHQALLIINSIFEKFRSRFQGKCSPVHFFWGSFDLAVTRFSGNEAPEHPGGFPNLPDWIAKEAYSHEVSSCGFWPGNEMLPAAAFYSYAYPTPEGFNSARVKPDAAYFHKDLGEFLLKYSDLLKSEDPTKTLLDFLQSTYEAAANIGNWDRSQLEKQSNNIFKS